MAIVDDLIPTASSNATVFAEHENNLFDVDHTSIEDLRNEVRDVFVQDVNFA